MSTLQWMFLFQEGSQGRVKLYLLYVVHVRRLVSYLFFYMVHLLHCTPLGNDGLSAEVSRLANLIGKLESKVSLHVMPSDHLL